ncbi:MULTISPECIES: CesT family type III secretion system chaperone [unclassified Brenneria]|uniref:CesT family type III secretion system chaperone n=1 Tax=unclassified Brenneria TaxID=2634434 RepID=UPI0029C4CB00|nr:MULTISPECIES: CesT family type III secretion system chaperone [unclassified Brenneria]MDX5630279.1 CesT family type III secretion system chaperone [Brenneria sp. L3-3Z]MDX5697424.1 CesT family type III secretion system chaperone [Brenneria sp. L4-2C]MEE3660893.1 CesT family type III secretion system chaperone [Brenneria sp. g21c3]
MSLKDYRALIDDFCDLAEIPRSSVLYERPHFEIDGIDFSLPYVAQPEPGHIAIHADLGPLHGKYSAQQSIALLDMNFHLFNAPYGAVLARNPKTENILLMGAAGLEQASAATLLSVLSACAAFAHQWHKSVATGSALVPVATTHGQS